MKSTGEAKRKASHLLWSDPAIQRYLEHTAASKTAARRRDFDCLPWLRDQIKEAAVACVKHSINPESKQRPAQEQTAR